MINNIWMLNMMRMKTHEVNIGGVRIGGDKPIAIQSMCNTKTQDIDETISQILELEKGGCEIIRVAVPDMKAAMALAEIKRGIHIPLVADIHFDYRLAIASIRYGADKVRINPGNIGGEERLAKVVEEAAIKGIPLRVGVNSGSLEKKFIDKYGGHVTSEGLVDSAIKKAHMIEALGYNNLVISIKASDVSMCIKAHELIKDRTDHPLHVGITEAGDTFRGSIKSAVGIGIILNKGIGDTIRVSLTGNPLKEVEAAKEILRALGLRKKGIDLISCPTCGRTEIDLDSITKRVSDLILKPCYASMDIKVACMGCTVNGPGEAKEADLAICGGRGEGLIIKKGEILAKVPESKLFEAFSKELEKLRKNHLLDSQNKILDE